MPVVVWSWKTVSDESTSLPELIRFSNERLGRLSHIIDSMVGAIQGTGTLALGSTTPTIAGAHTWLASNPAPTSITTFKDGQPGDERSVWATNANTTIVHSAAVGGIFLLGAANVTMGANETRRFGTVDGVTWRELAPPVGNALTATKLQTARTINGVAFDGSANITVPAAAGTLTGTTINATVTTSSLTSLGVQAADLRFTDALFDIGKSGATRPRDGFFSRNLVVGGTGTFAQLVVAAGGDLTLPGGGFGISNGTTRSIALASGASGAVTITTTLLSVAGALAVSGSARVGTYDTIGEVVTVVPAATLTSIYSLASGGQSSALVLVSGVDAGGNWFSDLVHHMNSNAHTVITTKNGGAPAARTYSVAGAVLQLMIGTAQTRVRVTAVAEINTAP